MSKITNDGRINPVWYSMLYRSPHMATVGVKGLNCSLRSTTRSVAAWRDLC